MGSTRVWVTLPFYTISLQDFPEQLTVIQAFLMHSWTLSVASSIQFNVIFPYTPRPSQADSYLTILSKRILHGDYTSYFTHACCVSILPILIDMKGPSNSMGKAFVEKLIVPQLVKKFLLISGMTRLIILLTGSCLRSLT
jgi:hypothetical protein